MSGSQISETSRNLITSYFDQHATSILRPRQMAQIIGENRRAWGLPESASIHALLECLVRETSLREIRLGFPSRPETRFTWGTVPPLEFALSLRSDAYFSHHSAMWLNGLTTDEPDCIYVNSEQTEKPRWASTLEQATIDAAFRRPPRTTSNVAQYDNKRICLLNGKHTGGLGVTTVAREGSSPLRVTDLERTLIDIAVRPTYSGGVEEVLQAYRETNGKASSTRIARMLSRLDYVYPYHQAIGFYLERSGVYHETAIRCFAEMPMEFDFYLTHQMSEVRHCERWRVNYPSSLDAHRLP